MPVYHVNKDATSEVMEHVNTFLDSEQPAFVLFYMDGCGPCSMTRPEWNQLETDYSDNDLLAIIDIEMSKMDDLHNQKLRENVVGFPTMRYIKKGQCEDYEDCDGITKDRSYRSFVEWIKKKEGKKKKIQHKQTGGRKNTKRKSRKSKVSKRMRHKMNKKSKRRHTKKHRKTHRKRGGSRNGSTIAKAAEDFASLAMDGVTDAAAVAM